MTAGNLSLPLGGVTIASAETPLPAELPRRVLSIQSHVVHGSVGNKSATFPLQLLGFEVDAINTVQLSNHMGYPHFAGEVLKGGDLEKLVHGLDMNDFICNYSDVLSGYAGSENCLESIAQAVSKVKTRNPTTRYTCDPVMGSGGRFYNGVSVRTVELYRDNLLPLADVITPNQFE